MIGRFYFKRTINGNLLGEFSNNQSRIIQTESAIVTDGSNGFVGNYITTWEEDGEVFRANLSIQIRANTGNRIFTLTWRENDNITFVGEGMLCDDLLLGDYRDVNQPIS